MIKHAIIVRVKNVLDLNVLLHCGCDDKSSICDKIQINLNLEQSFLNSICRQNYKSFTKEGMNKKVL